MIRVVGGIMLLCRSVTILVLSLHFFACADTWQIAFWEQISGTVDRTGKIGGFFVWAFPSL